MADLTIRFKGQTVLEMTESGTKTLKTAGKYCEDDISVEYAKPAGGGGGGSGFAETICTDVIANHIVSASWSPSVTAEEYIPPKYYYNGVLLPEIPPVYESTPYRVILKWPNGNIQLIGSANGLYFNGDTSIRDISGSLLTAYYLAGYNWAEDTKQNGKYSGWTVISGGESVILWSNHDIPNGSATATEIFFEGSEPVLTE